MVRHQSECGTKELKTFENGHYSHVACQWESKSKKIEDRCGCVPIFSSELQEYDNGTSKTIHIFCVAACCRKLERARLYDQKGERAGKYCNP